MIIPQERVYETIFEFTDFSFLCIHMASNQWKIEHKEDMLRYSRKWYQRNRQKIIDRTQQRRHEAKEWLRNMKGELKCEKCGQSHIACLQFHHSDPKQKDRAISKAIHGGWSKKRILKEISKCKVLCANCHAILHWNEE